MEKIDSLNGNGVWVAKSSDDIQRLVEEMACPVPPRGKGPDGRKSEDVERYSMAVLLGAIASYRLIPPFEVRKGERPDFVIKSNYEEIGIEHTEVVDPKEAEAVALKNLRAILNRARPSVTGMGSVHFAIPVKVMLGMAWKGGGWMKLQRGLQESVIRLRRTVFACMTKIG